MAARVKTGISTWSSVAAIRVKTGISTWSNVVRGRVKTGLSTWADFFILSLVPTVESRSVISLSGGINAESTIMNDSSAVTITSTRYHWDDADGFTYIWQKSPDNSNWSDIGTAQSTTNPSTGSSSSSITKVLSPSDFTSGSDMYFRFVFYATNSTYGTSASSESLSKLVSYYGTPAPAPGSPSVTGSTTVGNTASGNIGTWTNSPTSYDYRWFFMSGATSYPLTFSQSRSVSSKTLSGFSASISTTANHGYKANDQLIITGMDSLFNGTYTITSRTNNTVSFTLSTPTAWSASAAYSSGALVSYLGNAYYSSIAMPAPTLFSAGNAYNVGDNAWDGFTRYRCIQALSAVSAWSSSTNYPTGSIIHYNGTRWQAQQNSGPGYVIPGTSTPVGPQTPSSSNTYYWSEIDVRLSSTSYWANAYPYNSSYWTLQSFSNTAASGTTTGPNYYEGTVSSSTSISLSVPATDYRSGLNMIGKALYFGVKAYNPATLSPSEYSDYKIVYGIPSITLGSPSVTTTSISVPYSSSNMSSYVLNVTYLGTSVSGFPLTVTSPSSPISIIGLVSGRTYSILVTPRNGENTSGTTATTSATTLTLPSPPTITSSSSTTNSITLNFTAGANSTSTRAYIGGSLDGSTTGTSYTFSGLSPGTSYNLQLYGFDGTNQSTTSSGGTYSTQAGAALTPTFGTNTSQVAGFTGSVTNYNSSWPTWNISTSAGIVSWGTPSGSTYPFTVSGLSASQSATVTVTTSRTGYNNGSAQTTGSAQAPATYTVNWNANGGTVSPTSNSGVSGTVVTVPTPTRAGFNFLYWASSPSGDFITGPTAGSSYTITQNTTWYARWAVPTPVISTIVARNGGTGGAYKMQWTITSTNTASYTIIVRYGSTPSTVNAFSNTVSSSVIQTNLGSTINDYYILEITPWSGAGGTGSAGVQRTTTIKRNVSTPITNTTNNY